MENSSVRPICLALTGRFGTAGARSSQVLHIPAPVSHQNRPRGQSKGYRLVNHRYNPLTSLSNAKLDCAIQGGSSCQLSHPLSVPAMHSSGCTMQNV